MTIKALICIPLGHKWSTDTSSYDSEPLLRCKRCGRTREAGAGTRDRSRNPGNVNTNVLP
jgi:hypothetical protein